VEDSSSQKEIKDMEIAIELYVEIVEGARRITEIKVIENGKLVETIINDDRRKDLTYLNKYVGEAVVYTYFNGVLEIKGEFVGAGFNEEGITKLEYFEDEVFPN
jgi:hypothetical protein